MNQWTMNKKEDQNQPALKQHRKFLISRMISLQIVALSIIAVVIGITGIYLFRDSVYGNVSKSSSVICSSIKNYCESSVSKTSRSSEDIMKDEHISFILDQAGAETGMSIFLFDQNGECIVCSENSGAEPDKTVMPASLVSEMKNKGEIVSDEKGIFNTKNTMPAVSKGISISVTEKNGDSTDYYLFTNTFTDDVEHFTRMILIAGCASVIPVLILYAIFIRNFTLKYFVGPEESITRVIRNCAKGDFSETLNPEDFSTPYYQENVNSLNQIINNLKSTGEQQSQFVSNVSHELRTPMTIISGYINGILDGTVPKEKRTEYLYIISQEMQRLKILVSSMLNLTKYDNGTIQIKREVFPINDLIFRTFLMFENRLEKRNITVEGLDCDTLYVYGDRDLIGQVIYNLAENAVKFVDTGGTITITLEETKDASLFSIRNTGPGIPKDELPKIFGRFYKSDFSRSHDKTGLGLGLDIIRKILRLHDAQISVSSEENVFTEFSVSFPKKSDAQD